MPLKPPCIMHLGRYLYRKPPTNFSDEADEFFYNLRNFDADKFDSYTIYNSSVSWSSTDSQWQLTLAVRNLTDERAGTQGFDLASLCGCNEIAFREPRLYSVALRYEF